MNAVAAEVRDPESTIYHHQIQLRGAVPRGKGGWLVRIADRTSGSPICVVDLPFAGAIGGSENITVVPCTPPPAPQPAEPAPSSQAPA